jgi:HSP20 family protein
MVHTRFGIAPTFGALVNEFLQDANNGDRYWQHGHNSHRPRTNAKEFDDRFELQFVIPGIAKEDVQIKVEQNVLSVKFEKPEEKESEGKTLFNEFANKSFHRKFTLGKTIDTAQIAAKYEHGMLFLTLPKKAEEKTETINIEIL